MPEKLHFFLDFTNARLPMKKYFCFGESGYKLGTHRSGVVVGCWGAGGGWGLSGVGTRTSETKKYFCYKMVHNGIWDWCIVGYICIYIYILPFLHFFVILY